jgi:hypothetical protein
MLDMQPQSFSLDTRRLTVPSAVENPRSAVLCKELLKEKATGGSARGREFHFISLTATKA